MKMLFSYDSLCWLLLVPMQVTCNSAQKVSGMLGQNVTVPCRYSVKGGVMEMCWGRGECTVFMCTQKIISSDGNRVNHKKSDKYGLFGNLQEGDVSLTILHASEEDSETYCCRVEMKGWFNDQKHNTQLIIEKAPATTTSKPVTARGADTVNTSKGQITTSFWNDTDSTSNHITSSEQDPNSTQTTMVQSKAPLGIGVSVMLLLLLLAVLCFLFIFKKNPKPSRNCKSEQTWMRTFTPPKNKPIMKCAPNGNQRRSRRP
ncbi:hepatitis A virus cellular receptor 1 homolog isoform X1 [Acipenser ruthenus]|uniref:hepatitis A virus cellular receptor 1 homolog isoform X1 n=1 Tax=Acipenser ruthenus TaxID=7906 RepID=UPI0027418FA5|nr:hepatitis A virus cellular receptor 1 homolog isoform X1 [Acipenser ruthenus]